MSLAYVNYKNSNNNNCDIDLGVVVARQGHAAFQGRSVSDKIDSAHNKMNIKTLRYRLNETRKGAEMMRVPMVSLETLYPLPYI